MGRETALTLEMKEPAPPSAAPASPEDTMWEPVLKRNMFTHCPTSSSRVLPVHVCEGKVWKTRGGVKAAGMPTPRARNVHQNLNAKKEKELSSSARGEAGEGVKAKAKAKQCHAHSRLWGGVGSRQCCTEATNQESQSTMLGVGMNTTMNWGKGPRGPQCVTVPTNPTKVTRKRKFKKEKRNRRGRRWLGRRCVWGWWWWGGVGEV